MTNELQIESYKQNTNNRSVATNPKVTKDQTIRNDLIQALHDDEEGYEKIREITIALRNDPDNLELKKKENAALLHFMLATALENGENLGNSVLPFDKSSALVIRKNLIAEFQATTSYELMMIDIAVNAYFSYLRLSTLYRGLVITNESKTIGVNQTTINLMKQLTKQIDSAHTQMLTTLTTLSQLRRPPINVKIQTKEAYIAQNQQVNQTNT